MKTTEFLADYWQLNTMALAFIALMIVFHLVTNEYRLKRNSIKFFSGVILFALVTLSPLDFLSRNGLFSAHMVQHIVLLLIVPPLLLTGTDKSFLEKISNVEFLRKSGNIFFYPLVAWLFGVGSMWIMHVPRIMMLMDSSKYLKDLQMLILPELGWIFIWPVFTPVNHWRLEPLQSSVYLFLACVGCTVLGILITFSPGSMFASGMGTADMNVANMVRTEWGITPGIDQMMGGLIMWVPACIIYLTNIMIVLFRWFSSEASKV
jgi:putative membrane protein